MIDSMTCKYLYANTLLAELLGWTNVFNAGGTLVGCPPGGAPNSRGQAVVPDWCGDWQACGPLLCEFALPYIHEAHAWLLATEDIPDTYPGDREARIRYFIVVTAIERILAQKNESTTQNSR